MNEIRSREGRLLPSAVEAIARTPLVELSRLARDLDGRLLAKLDYLSPSFSNHFNHTAGDWATSYLPTRRTSLFVAWE